MATSPALSPPAEMRRVAGLAACRVPSGGHSNRTPGGAGDGAGGGGGGGGEGGGGEGGSEGGSAGLRAVAGSGGYPSCSISNSPRPTTATTHGRTVR